MKAQQPGVYIYKLLHSRCKPKGSFRHEQGDSNGYRISAQSRMAQVSQKAQTNDISSDTGYTHSNPSVEDPRPLKTLWPKKVL